jgi:hypothetical protein
MMYPALISFVLISQLSNALILPRLAPSHSPCRFSPKYTQDDIFRNSTAFVNDIFYWDGQFHQDGVGYNSQNGLTYDGVLLNQTTGLANMSERHDFSAASKEASLLRNRWHKLTIYRLCKS